MLGWYYFDANSNTYIRANRIEEGAIDGEIGSNLIQQVTLPADTTGINPKMNKWYILKDDSYILTEDEVVKARTTYYQEPEYYTALSDITSSITFDIGSTSEPVTYVLRDIFKYNKNPNLTNSFDAVKERLIGLDRDDEFNYAFVPSSNDLISNPLDARSFWNTNHIYNRFTIPQLDFNNLTYKFITTKK